MLSHGLPLPNAEAEPGPRKRETTVLQAPDGYGLLRLLRTAGKARFLAPTLEPTPLGAAGDHGG